MTDKQLNEIYRDFNGMAHSKTLSEIASWLDGHKGYELINRDEDSITFNFEKYNLVVCITDNGNVNIKKCDICDDIDDDIYNMLIDTSFLDLKAMNNKQDDIDDICDMLTDTSFLDMNNKKDDIDDDIYNMLIDTSFLES